MIRFNLDFVKEKKMKNKISQLKNEKNFIVVMRGESAAIFPKESNLLIKNFPSSISPVTINYKTRWLKNKEGNFTPGHIWIEINGFAKNLEEALVPFANAGLSILPILSLSANAAIHDPDLELAFDNTKGITERDYFQCYVSPESKEIHIQRYINIEVTLALINSLAAHPDGDRLRRAANQYRLALGSWRLGKETLTLAHLWMSIEALTTVKIRTEYKNRGLTNQEELAEELGIRKKDLDPYVRKEFLLKGDSDCYSKAKDASDGFEHGFLEYQKIRELSKEVRDKMAKYTRTAIIELCDLEKDKKNILLTEPLNKPLGYWPIVKYLRGKLIGKGDQLAAEGNTYPFIKWKSAYKTTLEDKTKKLKFSPIDSITPELSQGIKFKPISHEIWQAE